VGAAGLEATMAALDAGSDLALANKESLVAGGELVTAAVRRSGRLLLPVDSEHSALQQCLEGAAPEALESLVLTASGGPFRGWSPERLADVVPAQALAHPTWSMGAKITIDSATLANKGLEVIEAHFLFGLDYDRIEVVVHPTSIVHGVVRFSDGASIAHLGYPDMLVPISYALTYPDRAPTPLPALDLTAGPLEFFEPDLETFRLLSLARDAGERGGSYPCAFNAANEVAVEAFLEGRIGFLDIAALVEDALAHVDGSPASDLDELRQADRRARELVGAAWA
jgi:1-deoxy-D-xylulose-5-phosphate reductoisomerase